MDIFKIFGYIVDTILPPTDEVRVLRNISDEDFLALYQSQKVSDTIALSSYQNAYIRNAIVAAKFQNNSHASKRLASLFSKWISSQPNNSFLLLPVPLSKNRCKERGYNQVEEVLRHCSLNGKSHIDTTTLTRCKDTLPQSGLNRADRQQNIQHAFKVIDSEKIRGQHIILVDDVITSGATLREAKATLSPHSPASTITVALAH